MLFVRTKHFELNVHFVQDKVLRKQIGWWIVCPTTWKGLVYNSFYKVTLYVLSSFGENKIIFLYCNTLEIKASAFICLIWLKIWCGKGWEMYACMHIL